MNPFDTEAHISTEARLTPDGRSVWVETLRLCDVTRAIVAERLAHPEWVGDVALPREGE